MSEHHPFRTVREHLPHHGGAEPEPDAGTPEASADEPIPGYNHFTVAELNVEFPRHTQVQLDACEAYERGHLNREAVLQKLRYMHSRQPWQGYDDMPEEEILARLQTADDETIKHVRDYERKFGRRPAIHDAAMHEHHARQASAPATDAPTYQAGGGSFDNL